MAILAEQAMIHRQVGEDERELANLRQPDGDRERGAGGVADEDDNGDGGQRLADHDDAQTGDEEPGLMIEEARVKEHSDRSKKEDGKRITKGKRIGGGLIGNRRL